MEFGAWHGVDVVHRPLALSYEQVIAMNLPSRPPKKEKKAWEYPIAAELDAIAPEDLRRMVSTALSAHMPAGELERKMQIQDQHRRELRMALMDM